VKTYPPLNEWFPEVVSVFSAQATINETDAPVPDTVAPTDKPSRAPTTDELTTYEPTFEPTFLPTVESTFQPTKEPTTETPATTEPTTETPVQESITTGEPTVMTTDELTSEGTTSSPTVAYPEAVTHDPQPRPHVQPQPVGPKIYEISTMVMTYMMDPPVTRRQRRYLKKLSFHKYAGTRSAFVGKKTSSNQRNLNRNSNDIQQHEPDRELLQEITTTHVEKEIKREMTFWLEQQGLDEEQAGPLIINIDLTLTSVRSFLLHNETLVTTQAITGYISMQQQPAATTSTTTTYTTGEAAATAHAAAEVTAPAAAPQLEWPESMEPYLDAAFEGRALRRYQERLLLSEDPALQRTTSIEVGLPLDLFGGAGATTATENIASTSTMAPMTTATTGTDPTVVWTVAGIELSLTTLAIIAGMLEIVKAEVVPLRIHFSLNVCTVLSESHSHFTSSCCWRFLSLSACVAGFSILLLFCVCLKLRSIRKEHLHDDDIQHLESKSTGNSSNEEATDNTGKGSRKSKKSLKTIKTKNGKSSKNVDVANISSPSASSEMIDETDPGNVRYYQRYMAEVEGDDRSLATSTYSYLDSQLGGPRDNGHVCSASSFIYGNDDASLQSKAIWSLIDGITNDDATYNYHQTASPSPIRKKRNDDDDDDEDENLDDERDANLQTPEADLDLVKSPSNMMISTLTKAGSNYYDNDDMSLISVGVGTYTDQLQVSRTNTATTEDNHNTKSSNAALSATALYSKTMALSPMTDVPLTTPTATSQVNSPSNPFADDDNIEDIEKKASKWSMGRLGVSARKKNRANNADGNAGSSGVRKAIGQLAACGSSANDNDNGKTVEEKIPLVTGAPSDESGNSQEENQTPASVVNNRGATSGRKILSGRLSSSAGDSTLKEVNQRLQQMGDSTINSKNSSLLPGKLFKDDTLDSTAHNLSSTINMSSAIVISQSELQKDKEGNYMIDTMSSF